jgi:hypothetical protein
MNAIANVIVNSTELTEAEKVEAMVAIFGSHYKHYSQRDGIDVLSAMKKDVPYSCAEIAEGVKSNGSYETARGAACILRRFVKAGLVERTYIKTGKVFEIDNPRAVVLEAKINNCKQYHWYENYTSAKGDINTGYLPPEKFIPWAEALLAETKPTITIEEKKAVYTRLF